MYKMTPIKPFKLENKCVNFNLIRNDRLLFFLSEHSVPFKQ